MIDYWASNMFIIALLAAFTIYWEERKPFYWHYILKPLTTFCIILLAFNSGLPGLSRYEVLILVGLIFSLAGDVFLMLPNDRFIPGLVSFLIAQVVYAVAFLSQTDQYSVLIILPLLIYGMWIYASLLPHLENMKVPVLVYIVFILLMVWSALNYYWAAGSRLAIYAAVGAVFFLISDSILAWNRFKHPFKMARALVLATYFLAQTLIALSI